MTKATWSNKLSTEIPQWCTWFDKGNHARFFGIQVKELDREALIAIIGHLGE